LSLIGKLQSNYRKKSRFYITFICTKQN